MIYVFGVLYVFKPFSCEHENESVGPMEERAVIS
jgi:hypothetical protein